MRLHLLPNNCDYHLERFSSPCCSLSPSARQYTEAQTTLTEKQLWVFPDRVCYAAVSDLQLTPSARLTRVGLVGPQSVSTAHNPHWILLACNRKALYSLTPALPTRRPVSPHPTTTHTFLIPGPLQVLERCVPPLISWLRKLCPSTWNVLFTPAHPLFTLTSSDLRSSHILSKVFFESSTKPYSWETSPYCSTTP